MNKLAASLLMSLITITASVHVAHAEDKGVKPIKEVFEPKGDFPIEKFVKVAAVAANPTQNSPVPATKEEAEEVKQQNREDLEGRIREAAAAGAEIILTPEFGVVGYPDIPELPSEEDEYRNKDDIRPYVEKEKGTSFKFFSALAKELKVYLHYGLVIEDAKDKNYYNAVQVINPKGELVLTYYKMELFELENEFLSAGSVAMSYDSPAGKIGIIVCADVYSSTPLNQYRRMGIDALALSTSWARFNSGMLQFKSTAQELGVYLIAANQMYFPDTGVINPNGTLQSHIRQTEGIAYGFLPRKNKNKK